MPLISPQFLRRLKARHPRFYLVWVQNFDVRIREWGGSGPGDRLGDSGLLEELLAELRAADIFAYSGPQSGPAYRAFRDAEAAIWHRENRPYPDDQKDILRSLGWECDATRLSHPEFRLGGDYSYSFRNTLINTLFSIDLHLKYTKPGTRKRKALLAQRRQLGRHLDIPHPPTAFGGEAKRLPLPRTRLNYPAARKILALAESSAAIMGQPWPLAS